MASVRHFDALLVRPTTYRVPTRTLVCVLVNIRSRRSRRVRVGVTTLAAPRLRARIREETEGRVLTGVVVIHAVAQDEALRREQRGILQDHPLGQDDPRVARRARDRIADEL